MPELHRAKKGKIYNGAKKHLGFLIFFTLIIFLFLGKLIFMKAAFLQSDYLVQHYPWSKIYAESIKNFSFPFWVRHFHSGFPLMAEGQIGGFYPLNIIMFFILPFNVAYNYSVVLHFILAGLFTYIYSRKLGTDQWGGALAALLFCFGSAYAGCFNNTATVRTLVWFPLVLLLIENFLESKRLVYIASCGLICGMQLLAGFLQMAVYSFIFYIIYLCYGFKLKQFKLKDTVLPLFLFVIIASIIALPQVLLSFSLAQASGRSSASLGFALWRSFLPPCFLSAFFPQWMGLLGQHLYIGIFSILFLIYAITNFKYSPQMKPLVLVAVISVLAALGRYNPLYVAILKITKFYSFRNPSRFLFFGLFAGSVLSGFGFSRYFKSEDKKSIRSAARIFTVILTAAMAIFFIAKALLSFFSKNIILWLQNYTLKYVFDKPYHIYDLQTYMDKARGLCLSLVNGADLGNIFILFSLAMIVSGLAVGIFIYLKPGKIRLLKLPLFCLIVLDIYVYSFIGMGFTNMAPFDYIKPANNKILENLKSDRSLFRIAPFDMTGENVPEWAKPNANILYGLDSIAAYTPLAKQDYKEALSTLGVVDDSLGILSPSNEALVEKYQLLQLLNVKYIISKRKLEYGFLKKIIADNGLFLYRLKNYLPRVFFTYNIDDAIKAEPTMHLRIIEYDSGFVKIEATTNRDGFLVFSENFYPGWDAFIDGIKRKPLKVKNLIQAIEINKGSHVVIFEYKPIYSLAKR